MSLHQRRVVLVEATAAIFTAALSGWSVAHPGPTTSPTVLSIATFLLCLLTACFGVMAGWDARPR